VKLSPYAARHFGDDTLFHRIGRAVCEANCLPRKELYESWEVARRARRRFRGGRIVDLACGHALVAWIMLLLDDTSERAIAVDKRIPESADKIARIMCREWPRLAGRVEWIKAPIEGVTVLADDVVVSAHACGALTDVVLTKALGASAKVAVLPCCHEKAKCDRGGVDGWLDIPMAIDVTRAARLRAGGYDVHTQRIPETITPKNRLLLGWPARS
jgi:hypothetical protein